jgi:hypothetical protein
MQSRWPHDPAEAWRPYEPSPADPWDLTKVLRMHRRAGFGATWAEAQRDLAAGHETAIGHLLNGAPQGPDGRPGATIDAFADAMSESYRSGSEGLGGTRQVWFFRMVYSAWPLRERMLLAWHNHYATSETKVYDKEALSNQHLTQRKLWRSPASQLQLAMLRDEATLTWLDGAQNLRGSINENLAREFLELFALGVGNFSEADVKDAARTLTGWQRVYERTRRVKYTEALHDPGEKVILGQRGAWHDEDLARIASSHPAAARRIAWRLWRTFVSDVDEPSPELLEGLAAPMRLTATSTWPGGWRSCCTAGCFIPIVTPAAAWSARWNGSSRLCASARPFRPTLTWPRSSRSPTAWGNGSSSRPTWPAGRAGWNG